MKIEIIERNYDVGNRLRNLLEKKVEKLSRYFEGDAECKIVCKQENKTYKLEISIVAKNAFYRAEVIGENMFDNIDTALPKIEKQIVRKNGKMKDKKQPELDFADFAFLEEAPEESMAKITKKKTFSLDPITEEDAIFMLEATDHDFYIFLNAETGYVNVIYKRKDGALGLIEVKA